MSDSSAPTRYVWPALMVGALVLGGLTFAPWGYGEEGVEPSINGLGEVSVPGATAEDVAILQEHTQRPGLLVLGLAALVLVGAVLAWWQPPGRKDGRVDVVLSVSGSAVCGLGGLLAAIQGLRVVLDPSARLFTAEILALVGEVDGPILQPSWGAYGVIVVGLGITVGAVAGTWFRKPH